MYEINTQGGLWPCTVQDTAARGVLTTSTTAAPRSCRKQLLWMIALKTGGKKAAGKVISSLNTCILLYLNFTHGNSFSPGVSDIFCHKTDAVKAKVFWKTCQPLPRDPNSRAQQPLSSQRLPSHEPCNPFLTPMVRLSPRCCQSV